MCDTVHSDGVTSVQWDAFSCRFAVAEFEEIRIHVAFPTANVYGGGRN
jgi:hypothetical protein